MKINLEEIETRLDAKGIEKAFQTAQQKNVNAIMPTNATSWFTSESDSSNSPENIAFRLSISRASLLPTAV
jgi:hypothetical protein